MLGVIGGILFIGYGIVQFITGYAGIEHELNHFWAILALIVAFTTRIVLPISIGSFFYAWHVWEWHWALALIFALPSILVMIPSVIFALSSLFQKNHHDR